MSNGGETRNDHSWVSIIDHIGINPGDMVYISSELLMLMWKCQKKKEHFDANDLLDHFMELVGEEGTILIPTYNFDYSNQGYYDRRNSISTVGFLGNIALERKDYIRTQHPMHSFAVWGKYQRQLIDMNNSNSFGEDSPFAFMIEHGAKEIGIGIDDYSKACTFVHYVEVKAEVPYRFIKTFQGTYIDLDGTTKEYIVKYSAKDRTIQYKELSEGMWEVMSANGAGARWNLDGIPIYSIDMKMAYPNLYQEIKENHMQRIMAFSIDRDELFSGSYIVHED